MRLKNWFYRLMYRKKIIKLTTPSGADYIIEYHRSPFWTYEKPTLKLFFTEKCNTWHGQVWRVFKGGSRCGFGTWCIHTPFPRHQMKGFLVAEVRHLDKILNKEN